MRRRALMALAALLLGVAPLAGGGIAELSLDAAAVAELLDAALPEPRQVDLPRIGPASVTLGPVLGARFHEGGVEASLLHDVVVRYEPYNRPPRFEEFRPSAANGVERGLRKFHWEVRDPDGDTTEVRLDYRPVGAAGWAVATIGPVQETASEAAREEGVTTGELVWSLDGIQEGEYEVRGVVTDRPANPPGEGVERAARSIERAPRW